MEIRLKSNGGNLYMFLKIMTIMIMTMFFVGIIYSLITKESPNIIALVVILVSLIILLAIIVVINHRPKREYIFTEKYIKYCKKNIEYVVQVDNIESMVYCRTRFYRILISVFIALIDGGLYGMQEITIKEKDGTLHEIGYFSLKDIKRLKTLYNEKLIIE